VVEKIGPYEIVSVLGEGGMGVVYLAEQQEPIRRMVALKVVRKTNSPDILLGRFEAERRALARLNHPNVAQVFDSGTADDGSPFIVMEHVDGEDIIRFCESRRATIGERIEVFIDVCKGVQHVHQKGLIHRDLKPPNILVADRDGTWTPKIIDFGIAKGFGNPLSDETLTRVGGFVGTPMYVAPEVLKNQEQDTRVDVYALGMVLYRLLIGVKPVPPESTANLVELMRSLARGEAVPALTTRFRQLTATERARVGKDRQIQPRALEVLFARDLDWIVMRAIHAEPDLRYETPAALATDLQRYLRGEPVIARPPSLAYVGLKALRRNRWAAAGAAVLSLSMVLGTASTLYQASRVREQAQVALEAAERAERAAREADEKRVEAEQVSQLMAEMFTAANPFSGMSVEPTVQDLLDRAAASLQDRELPPLVRAKLLSNLASAYQGLSKFELAISTYREALAALEGQSGQELAAARVHGHIAGVQANLFRDAEALEGVSRALAALDDIDAPEHERALAHRILGTVYLRQGDIPRAMTEMERALGALRSGPSDPENEIFCLQGLAQIAVRDHKFDEAAAFLDEALELLDRDMRDPRVVSVMHSMGEVQLAKGEPEQAIATMREALGHAEEHLGAEHFVTRNLRLNTAFTAAAAGHLDEAKPIFQAFVDARDEIPHTMYVPATLGLADVLMRQYEFARSEALLRELVTDETLVPSRAAEARYTLAQVIASQGRRVEAERAYRVAIDAIADLYGLAHPQTLRFALMTGLNWFEDDNPAEAEHYFRIALAGWDELNAKQQHLLLTGMVSLLKQTDRAEEAAELEVRLAALQVE